MRESAGVGIGRAVRWGEPQVVVSSEEHGTFLLPAGTITLVLGDVEGSSRRWESDRDAMAQAVVALNTVVDDAVGRHGGVRQVEQGEGDSFVAAFDRASDALACALDVQRATPLPLRIGIHTGEVQKRDDGNYMGAVPNRCARLRDLGHGGQILLSRATYDLVLDRLPDGVVLRDLGPHRLRDLHRPEHVFQAGDAEFPPLRSLDHLPNNLPTQLKSFVGRDREMAEVAALVTGCRLVTLTGSGGCGKTRLAVQVAARVMDAFPDGVWFCDLGRVNDPGLVPQALAGVLGLRDEATRSLVDTITDYLKTRRVLVLLDNCEHLVEACASLAETIVRACGSVTVLATSREPLGVDGEATWRVPSLALPEPGALTPVEALTQFDAVRLFVERAVRVRPNFSVTNENAPAVAQICHRLGGIALAIELAAARTRMMTPAQIAAGLDDRFHLLGAGPRTAVPRQQTLEASVEWSHDLLSQKEQMLFRRLSVFAAGFTLTYAEQVCPGEGIEQIEVLDLLSGLIDKSLVIAEENEGTSARFHMLETIRQYAAAQLTAAGEDALAHDALVAFFVAGYKRAFRHKPGDRAASLRTNDRALIDCDSLRVALRWALARNDQEAKLGLVGSLNTALAPQGLYREMRGWAEEALAQTDESFPILRMRALTVLGGACFALGEFASARSNYETALEIAERHRLANNDDDLFVENWIDGARRGLASIAQFVEGHVLRSPASEDPRAKVAALIGEGNCAHALEAVREILESDARSGNPLVVMDLISAAVLSMCRGDFAACDRFARDALRLARQRHELQGEFNSLYWLGLAATHRGDHERARSHAGEILATARSTSLPGHECMALINFACDGLVSGDLASAHDSARGAVEIFGRTGAEGFVRDWVAPLLAEVLWARGDHKLAAETIDSCRVPAGGAGPLMPDARRALYATRARIARAEGDIEGAEAAVHELVSYLHPNGARILVPDALEQLGELACDAESYAEAVRLFGAAETMRAEMGVVRPVPYQGSYDESVARARAGLGPQGFEDAWAQGAAMSDDEVVAYARRGRGERKRPSSGWASLTPSELEAVSLVAQGLTNPEIAGRLFVSQATVKTHLLHVFAKLGVKTRAELAVVASKRLAEE